MKWLSTKEKVQMEEAFIEWKQLPRAKYSDFLSICQRRKIAVPKSALSDWFIHRKGDTYPKDGPYEND
jgi:hypothetical protein